MEEKKDQLFRQKSLEKISSPDELDKYIKTASPGVVLLFISLIVFFAGLITWGFIGTIETKSAVGFSVEGGKVTSYITETDYDSFIKNKDISDVYLVMDGKSSTNFSISSKPTQANEDSNSYLLHAAEIEIGEWYYEITSTFESTVDGSYKGKIVYEKVSPISFLF